MALGESINTVYPEDFKVFNFEDFMVFYLTSKFMLDFSSKVRTEEWSIVCYHNSATTYSISIHVCAIVRHLFVSASIECLLQLSVLMQD